MYEAFFGMEHTPFVRDVPPEKLYESNAFRETLGRLSYVADRQMFAVVTADPGCGKSTLIRRFYSELPKEDYIVLYLSDSKLTPRWFYKGLLHSPDDLDLLLQLAFGITTVKPGFQSQLVQQPFIKPPWCQL